MNNSLAFVDSRQNQTIASVSQFSELEQMSRLQLKWSSHLMFTSLNFYTWQLNYEKYFSLSVSVCRAFAQTISLLQCFTSPPTQYRLYGRRFLQVKRPNQQYKSTEGESTKENTNNSKNKVHTEIRIVHAKKIRIYNTASPLVYSNMG